ncbi:MAG: DUF87 domain-containing protein [Lachnospiraceae bacterium]|nr:DUF87 domain-containing protein [Lachnospiraceae bacterium]
MRVIPKKTNVRMELFPGLELVDVLVGAGGAAITVLFALSNLPGHFIIAIIIAVLTAALIVPIDDDKGYLMILYFMRYLGRPRTFTKKGDKGEAKGNSLAVEDITPFTGINGKFIEYGQDYFATVVEIPSVEFRFYTELRQNTLIDRVFGGILRMAAENEQILLVKLDRPLIFDDMIANEHTKLGDLEEAYLNNLLNDDELTVRVGIVEDRIAQLDKMNYMDRIFQPFHYVMFVYKDKNLIQSQAESCVQQFSQNGIAARQLEDKELAVFLKYNYNCTFDEREVKNLTPDQYMNWILPEKVKFTTRQVWYDDLITWQFRLRDYPVLVGNAWAAPFYNEVGTKVVMRMTPIDRGKAIRQIDRSLEELRSQHNDTGKASKLIDLSTQIQALANVLRLLQGENEILFNVNTYIQVNDYDLSEATRTGAKMSSNDINATRKDVRRRLAEEGFKVTDMFMQEFEGYVSESLGGVDAFAKYQRGIHSGSVAAAFPFVYKSLNDKNGLFIGNSAGIPVFIDFFKRDSERVNSNTIIIGKSGSGKSYATKSILAQLAAENSKIFILDPENEYTKMAKGLHGKVIDVGSATQGRLNPFHIITSLSDDEETEEGAEGAEESGETVAEFGNERAVSFSTHLQFLEEFYRQILPGLTVDALEQLNSVTVEMYEDKGIDEFTDLSELSAEDYPTFDDLYETIINDYQKTQGDYSKNNLRILTNFISKFSTGGRDSQLWNGPASITTEENFVVFDFQSLLANKNGTVANAQMLLVLKWLDNEIIKNREYNMAYHANRKIVIVIDEAHVFIDDKFPIALDFMFQLAKRIRKYNGMQIVITQNIKDFVGTEELARKSTAIINASQYSFIFPLAPNDMTDLVKLYENAGGINEGEQDDIVNNGRGRAFVITSPSERTNVDIVAGEGIEDLFMMT